MTIRTRLCAMIAAAGLVSTGAAAQQNGDIIFTDELTDTVRIIDGANSSSALISFAPDNEFRLGGLINANGQWYVANGPSVQQTTPDAQILRLNNLFGASSSTLLYGGDPLFNPIGLAFDSSKNQILAVNNPGVSQTPPGFIQGVTGLNLTNNNLTTLVSSPGAPGSLGVNTLTSPSRIVADPFSNDFFIIDSNGGAFQGTSTVRSAAIWRLSIDANNVGSLSVVVDFGDTATTGIAAIDNTRGILAIGSDLFITEVGTDAIYKISLDGSGNFSSASTFLSGVGLDGPQEIVYNQFTDKIVFSDAGTQSIYQVNTDGTGFETLLTGVNARGIGIVPAPAGAAVLAMGAFAGTRRRR